MILLGISGSVRTQSASTALLKSIASLTPSDVRLVLFDELEKIPAFNPDRAAETSPPVVARWAETLGAADALLFSTPEYAHGVPGVLKNALDWVVGSGELYDKRAAIVLPALRGEYALASLTETLRVMGVLLAPSRVMEHVDAIAVGELLKDVREIPLPVR